MMGLIKRWVTERRINRKGRQLEHVLERMEREVFRMRTAAARQLVEDARRMGLVT